MPFYFAGWGLMIYATFLMDHFELFGLRQAWTAYLGGECRSTSEIPHAWACIATSATRSISAGYADSCGHRR